MKEIVKRASELEASHPTASGAMTIGGVEAIAGEVGIAPELVRSAAKAVAGRGAGSEVEVAPQRPPVHNYWVGGPTRIVFERIVEGELPEADFPVIVDEIRRLTRNVGQAGSLGRSLNWSMTRAGGGMRRDVEVVVTVRRSRTRIQVQENLGQLIGSVFGPIGGGMGGGGMGMISSIVAGGLDHPALLPLLIPVWLGITYATARTVYKNSAKKRVRELETLADSLAQLTRELIAER